MNNASNLATVYEKLPDINQHLNLIRYIKSSSNGPEYNWNHARASINSEMTRYFNGCTILRDYPPTEISQQALLLDFCTWVHLQTDNARSEVITTINQQGVSGVGCVTFANQCTTSSVQNGDMTTIYNDSTHSINQMATRCNDNRLPCTESVCRSIFNKNGLICTGTSKFITENHDISDMSFGVLGTKKPFVPEVPTTFLAQKRNYDYAVRNSDAVPTFIQTAGDRSSAPDDLTVDSTFNDQSSVSTGHGARYRYEMKLFAVECDIDNFDEAILRFGLKYRCVNQLYRESCLYYIMNKRKNQIGKKIGNERRQLVGCSCEEGMINDKVIKMMVIISCLPNTNGKFNVRFRVEDAMIARTQGHFLLKPTIPATTLTESINTVQLVGVTNPVTATELVPAITLTTPNNDVQLARVTNPTVQIETNTLKQTTLHQFVQHNNETNSTATSNTSTASQANGMALLNRNVEVEVTFPPSPPTVRPTPPPQNRPYVQRNTVSVNSRLTAEGELTLAARNNVIARTRHNQARAFYRSQYQEFRQELDNELSTVDEFEPDETTDEESVTEETTEPTTVVAMIKKEFINENNNNDSSVQENKNVNRGRPKADARTFAKKHMLTDMEHKSQFGFYKVTLLGDENEEFQYDDDTFPQKVLPTRVEEPETLSCLACLKDFVISEKFVVINTACKTHKHVYCHACFHLNCQKHFHYRKSKGPNRLFLFDGCKVCGNYEGEWRNAKYFPKLQKWKIGMILPDNVRIIGVHQRMWKLKNVPRSETQYNNYIVDAKLYAALMKHLGIVDGKISKQFRLTKEEAETICDKYFDLNTGTFKCTECKETKKQIYQGCLKGCEENCNYSFCQECFVDKIVSDTTLNSYQRYNGSLVCPLCNQRSRAVYRVNKNFMCAKNRSSLLA